MSSTVYSVLTRIALRLALIALALAVGLTVGLAGVGAVGMGPMAAA